MYIYIYVYIYIHICVCLWENLYLEHQKIMRKTLNTWLYLNKIAFVQPKHMNVNTFRFKNEYIYVYIDTHTLVNVYIYICIYIYTFLWENVYLEHQNIIWESLYKSLCFHKSAFVPRNRSNVKHSRKIPALSPPDLLRNMHIIYPA